MELIIGARLRQLRRQKELTQEEVAAHIGVSYQAISKWERGEGYPDITMLPALANYFGVTVDELLGMDAIASAERYAAINAQWQDNRVSGRHSENVELMRGALRAYPNDPLMLVQLSSSLERLDGTPEEKMGYLMESIAVQEQIMDYCPDCEVRGATLYNLCFAYEKAGRHERALEQARKLSNLYKSRENALALLADGEERLEAARASIEPLKWIISTQLNVLADASGDDGIREKAKNIEDMLTGIQNA